MGELVVQTIEEADDEVMVGHGRSEIAQFVSEDLEFASVGSHRQITLGKGVELLAHLDSALEDVVEELLGTGSRCLSKRSRRHARGG